MRSLALVVAVVAVAAACTPPASGGGTGGGPVTNWAFNPKATDPAIANDAVFTHLAWAPTGTARGRLAVLFHGTGANPQALTELAGALRADGYHVIALRYSAALGTTGACPDSNAATDPDCHRTFRAETVFGENVEDPDGVARNHPLVSINASNSVLNRLEKAVEYLRGIAPTAGWEQFQQRDAGGACVVPDTTYGTCALRADRLVLVGHSQGAGVALYLSKFLAVDRVAMLSGSYDGYNLGGGTYSAAPWLTDGPPATTADRVGTLLHTSDFGLGLFRTVENAIGVTGPEVSVTANSPPYGGSRRLITSTASTCPFDGTPAHQSTAVDLCTPDGLYAAAWRYLAGSS
ncbi:MAG: BPSS1187 family protein [Microthrixaceae bacterium]